MSAYQRMGTLPSRRWCPDARARFVGPTLDPTPFLDERAVAQRWIDGTVTYFGREGARDDWRGAGEVKLWRYERQYHRELVSLCAQAANDRSGPWLEAAAGLVESWASACAPARGDAWEPYPVARRILSWAIAGCLIPTLGQTVASRFVPQLRFLSCHFERHLLGNHILCDAAALVAGAAVVDAEGAEAIGRSALELLTRELHRQVLPDGGYAERTVQYHAIVLQDVVVALGLWRARGRAVPPETLDVIRRMATFLARVRRADGSWPWLNDAAPDATPSLERILALAEALGLGKLAELQRSDEDYDLPDTGWYFARRDKDELLFERGPIGPDEQPGHGHSDALSFELIWRGRPLVVDTGVTTYEANEDRAFERSARAHSALSVDGEGADELWAAFRVGARGRITMSNVARVGEMRVLRGTLSSPAGWVHSRVIGYEPGRALVVGDRVTGVSPRRCRLRLPLAPGVSFADGRIAVEGYSLNWSVARGHVDAVESGWIGAGFGRRIPRRTLSIEPDGTGAAVYAIAEAGVALDFVGETVVVIADGKPTALDLV
jgi:hypothetical protein